MQSRRFRLLRLATIMAAAIYCGGLSNAGAFNSAQHLIVAQAPEKAVGEGEGVIKGVDESEHKLLISHGPISGALEMPAMVMSFRVAPDIDLSSLAPGAKVRFTLSRDAKGLYVIDQIRRDK